MEFSTLGIWRLHAHAGIATCLQPTQAIRISTIAIDASKPLREGRSTVTLLTYTSPWEYDQVVKSSSEPDTAVLCSLTPGQCENFDAELYLECDRTYVIKSTGSNDVYLSGNLVQLRSLDVKSSSKLKRNASCIEETSNATNRNHATTKDEDGSERKRARSRRSPQPPPPIRLHPSIAANRSNHLKHHTATPGLAEPRPLQEGSRASQPQGVSIASLMVADDRHYPFKDSSLAPPRALGIDGGATAADAQRSNMILRHSGIVAKKGTSEEVARAGALARIVFIVRGASRREVLSSSVNEASPYCVTVGVPCPIPGLAESLAGMRIGEERLIYVPTSTYGQALNIECKLVGLGN